MMESNRFDMRASPLSRSIFPDCRAFLFCVLLVPLCAPSISFSKSSNEQRDLKHHESQKEQHTFKDRTIRKFSTTKKDLEEFKQHPQGKHVTTQSKGRMPSSETAKKNYGLKEKPKYVFTGKAKELRVQGKGHDKPVGGKHNATEGRVAQKKVEWQNEKIKKLDSKK